MQAEVVRGEVRGRLKGQSRARATVRHVVGGVGTGPEGAGPSAARRHCASTWATCRGAEGVGGSQRSWAGGRAGLGGGGPPRRVYVFAYTRVHVYVHSYMSRIHIYMPLCTGKRR